MIAVYFAVGESSCAFIDVYAPTAVSIVIVDVAVVESYLRRIDVDTPTECPISFLASTITMNEAAVEGDLCVATMNADTTAISAVSSVLVNPAKIKTNCC